MGAGLLEIIKNIEVQIRQPGSACSVFLSSVSSIQSLVQNPKYPKSKIQNLHKKNCYITLQNPKSKIQNLDHWGPHKKNCYITIQMPKSKLFGPDFGDFGFRILDCYVAILLVRPPVVQILDFGPGFWILGGPRQCTIRQFSHGALKSKARIPPGPPTVSDTVGGRKN